MTEVQALLTLVTTVIAIAASIGAAFAFTRMGYGRMAGEVQDRVIQALRERERSLEEKIEELEKEVAKQRKTVHIIRYALQQQGMEIAIDGDMVTITEHNKPRTRTVRVRASVAEEASKQSDSDDTTGL